MSESAMRREVVGMLRPLHAVAVENPLSPGTPDVNCTAGWIELKWFRQWPKRPEVCVPFPHFTKEQRNWHEARGRAGERTFVLVRCKKEWLLFIGEDIARFLGKFTIAQLRTRAARYTNVGLKEGDLAEWLTTLSS